MIIHSFNIITLLTHILNTKEVSIYLTVLQILNLICTLSFDWIAKAVLRFYEKYDLQDKQSRFLSTVFWLSIVVYSIVLVLYFLTKDLLTSKLAFSQFIFTLTILLVIPCGIRQALYQILRTKNRYMLYTGSIILYQLLFIAGFLAIVNIFPNASSLILSMILAIVIIDIYIYYSLHLQNQIKPIIDKRILTESLKYALPLVITSLCYWALFHTPRLLFQSHAQYLNSAVYGISWTLATNALSPAASLFMFVNFPVIIKNFEHKRNIKPYVTSVIQIYSFILLPFLCGICFFASDIVKIMLPPQYSSAAIFLPIFAIMIFSHEMMKMLNIKYHLKNNTYIETFLGIIIVSVFFVVSSRILIHSPVLGAWIMLITEFGLILTNIIVRFQNLNFIDYKKVIKTISFLILTNILCCLISNIAFQDTNNLVCIIKLIAYFLMTYTIQYALRKRILF